MKQNNRAVGAKKEEAAAAFLSRKGYLICEKNYRSKRGEIDIIAKKDKYLVFVEVKYRKNTSFGNPEEAVTLQKQCIISQVAQVYMLTHGYRLETSVRFDVIAIEGEHIRHYENAFLFRG